MTPKCNVHNDLQGLERPLERGGAVQTVPEPSGADRSLSKHLADLIKKGRIDEMKNLYSSGFTLQQIADLHNITRERVRQLIKDVITRNEGGQHVRASKRVEQIKADREANKKPKHGRRSVYGQGCRCELCTKANTDYCREVRHERQLNRKLEVDKELEDEILRNIALSGSTETKINPIVGGNLSHILNLTGGSPRLQTNVVERFKLILGQPLAVFNPFQIRCCLCGKVVSYPAWYYSVKYAVNHFHYFVCFDKDSPSKPSVKCYRRDV